jgi:hypothetical protein
VRRPLETPEERETGSFPDESVRLVRGTHDSKSEDNHNQRFGVERLIPKLCNDVLMALAQTNESFQGTASAAAVAAAFKYYTQMPQLCTYLAEEAARRLHSGNVPSTVVSFNGTYVQRTLQMKLSKSKKVLERLTSDQ